MQAFRFLQKASALLLAAVLLCPAVSASAEEPVPGSVRNNSVVHTPGPRAAGRTVPVWEKIYGLGYPGPLLLSEGRLFCLHGGYADYGTLTALSPADGAVLATRETCASPSRMAPCSGDGRIYCLLEGGILQAFRSSDLEPLWTYRDPGKAAPCSPMAYADGRLYVGLGHQSPGSFLCLDAKTGKRIWSAPTPRGQSGCGPLLLGNYVVYGDEAGHLLVRDRYTGDPVQELTVSASPIRSSVCYAENRIFFTTWDARLHYGVFHEDTGKVDALTTVDCGSANTLSTPVVRNGYAYLAVGSPGGGENQVVCVDTVANEVLWSVPAGVNSMGPVLLTDTFAKDDGLYLYVTSGLGGVTVVRVPSDGSEPSSQELFLPEITSEPQACPIASDAAGTLYYTNPSSAILAIGPDEAWLDSLELSVGRLTSPFDPAVTQYSCLVPKGTQSLSFILRSHSQVTLNAGEITAPVPLTEGKALAVFTVTDGAHTREYTVEIAEESGDTMLQAIVAGHGDTLEACEQQLPLIPAFRPELSAFSVFSVDSAASRNSVHVWPIPQAQHAKVKVYAVSNVRPGAYDRETQELLPELADGGFDIPFADQNCPIVIRIEVVAENGSRREYQLLLSKAQSRIEDIGLVTLERKSWIAFARNTCDSLPPEQLQLLPNYSVLVSAEQELSRLEVEALIQALDALTPESTPQEIADLRAAYDAMTPEQQAQITNYHLLTEAEDLPADTE